MEGLTVVGGPAVREKVGRKTERVRGPHASEVTQGQVQGGLLVRVRGRDQAQHEGPNDPKGSVALIHPPRSTRAGPPMAHGSAEDGVPARRRERQG